MQTKMIIKNITSVILALVIATTTFSFHFEKAQAWEQGANGSHEEINKTAVSRFLNASTSNPKFTNSPLVANQQFLGNETTSATLNAYEFSMQKSSLTFSQWVTHGGFSADEPEVWACVRHFYDPLAVNGLNELTDHLLLTSQVYETISAKDWAFKATENPYSWRKAMEYYKQAMEIPDDSKITVVKGMDFRDTDITVSSPAEARSVYLGKAFRALGETMHMMADITQPSHVRNDSHPSIDTDPLESTINKDTVRLVRDAPVLPSIGSAIDSADNLEDMYEEIAIFTNNSFYTDDTVSDAASGVKQSNHENPYPHPQFSELTLDTKTGVYSKTFNGKPVRMTQKTFSSYVLGPLWTDYTVPAAFATEQAEVLVPVAIKANTKVINSFFPTFDLTLDVKENKNASTNGNANYKEYTLDTQLKHLIEKDVEWQKSNQPIQYTGPAELWGETNGKGTKVADLIFKAGIPLKPVTVFVGDEKYQKVDKYQINNADKIYVVIKAGGRIITSNKFAMPLQLSISPSNLKAELNKEYTFTAKTSNPPAKAVYTWAVNGSQKQNTSSNTYKTKFTVADDYEVAVKLIGSDGKELASASAKVNFEDVTPTATTSGSNLALLQQTSYVTGQTGDARYNYEYFESGVGTSTENAYGPIQIDHVEGNPQITWNGSSFSGKSVHTSDITGEVTTIDVNGKISADGNVLESFSYQYNRKGASTIGKYSFTNSFKTGFTLQNMSMSYIPLGDYNVYAYAKSKSAPTITYLEEAYRDGELIRKGTKTFAEWYPDSENRINFSKAAK